MKLRPRREPRPAHRLGDGGLRDVATGFACLGRGMVHVLRRPRLLLLGALPALLSSILLVGAIALLVWGSEPLVTWLTPFASGWHPIALQMTRSLLAAVVVLAGVLAAVLSFGALTMAVGAPFHDEISRTVDRECGGLAEPVEVGAWESLRRGAVDGVAGVGLGLAVALVVLLVSLVPVVGQVAAPLLGALAGGLLLTMELVQPSFERRGLTRLAHRRSWVLRFREVSWGFGIPVYLSMLVPLLGIVVFPGAVAGATLLTRTMRGEHAVPSDQH